MSNNISVPPSNDSLSTIVLILNAFLPLICFYFYTNQSPLNSLTSIGWILVALLSLPNLIALKKNDWIKVSYWTTLTALLVAIIGTSFNLWQVLLQGNKIELANHLLALLFGLLLSSALQMHLIRFSKSDTELSITERVSKIFQGPSLIISLVIAMIIVNVTLIFLNNFDNEIIKIIGAKFLTRGIIPPLTLLLFFWGLVLLLGKLITIYLDIARNKAKNLHQIYYSSTTANAKTKLLELCWQQLDGFYAVPKYINWAIPILGFIGTVLGISLATEGLSDLLATSESNYSQLLSEALSPLGIAFDTTLIALTLSIFLTLLQTLIYRWEEKLLSQFEQNPTMSEL